MCILKQVKNGFTADGGALSGVLYAERMGELILTPRFSDIAPVREGRYALVVAVGERVYFFEWRGNAPIRVPEAPPLAGGFCALLAFVRLSAEPEPIAFGKCGACAHTAATLLRALKGTPSEQPSASDDPQESAPAQEQIPIEQQKGDTSPPPRGYEDEAIAERDYFSAQEQKAEGQDAPQNTLRRSPAYYESVREKLLAAFREGGEDQTLSQAIPLSRWTRRGNALVGIVFELGMPKYLCAAVPAEGEPPALLQGKAVRVPVTFGGEEAYYVLFQDAETGECVKVYAE